ncbi:MAG: hypothetical protein KF723_11900 [Rhizobiaceae bacterium]|nr:hypothetical protein [Rhizobiaceae bacterium]
MAELEAYSALIAEIYDAALDTSRWQPTLKLAGDFVGGVSGSLFWHDSAAGNVSVLSVADEDAKVTRTYVEHYARLNPVFPAATFLEPGIVYAATDIVPYDDFVGTRFFQEWVKPQGVLDAIAANLERSATASAMVAFRLRTDDSPAGEEPRRKLGLLVPHIKRAAAIGRLLEQNAARARALSTTFDRISAAVFLVDRKGRTVYANASGDALTAERRLVRNDMGRLVAADAAADRELQDALKAGHGVMPPWASAAVRSALRNR